MQVGQSGKQCSFETSLLLGPFTALGRNEGYLKTEDEMYGLIPYFDIPQKIRAVNRIASGMTIEEYRLVEARHTANQNLYPDVLTTINYCNIRSNVPPKHIQNLLRYLFHNNYLNVDVIIAAYREDAVSKAKARKQFWKWFNKTYNRYDLNYYILPGNKNMIRKLYNQELITDDEAKYLLSRWFLRFSRLECSMIEDMEYFKVVKQTEANMLLRNEALHIPQFAILLKKKDAGSFDSKIKCAKEKIRQNILRPNTIPGEIL